MTSHKRHNNQVTYCPARAVSRNDNIQTTLWVMWPPLPAAATLSCVNVPVAWGRPRVASALLSC